MNFKTILLAAVILWGAFSTQAQETDFQSELKEAVKPWTNKKIENDPDNFQFAIVSDRTGGHRKGVFGKAVEKLNLLQPEFVMSVGDLIEGYTKDTEEIDKQWAEFDSLLDPLAMRFFPLPGNHDISNDVMRKKWVARYGRAYYHFVYKGVLFLLMDSNDGDNDATLSSEQIAYMKQAIADNPEVRWTMVFMHHPIWLYSEFNGFAEVEAALQDRDYTVYAGHYHRYMQALRKDRNYYVLASTGGGSRLRGPSFGEFDHVSWITMKDDGPIMLNLKLDGMLDHDVSNERTRQSAQALIEAAGFHSLMTRNEAQNAGIFSLGVSNSGNDTIFLKGRIYHHHHLELESSKIDLAIAPHSDEQVDLKWTLSGDLPWERIDPIELDFSIGYKTAHLDPEFELNGTYTAPKVIKEGQIGFTHLDAFTDRHTVALEHGLQGLELRYTLDGSAPTRSSALYTKPFDITESTTVKAAFFHPSESVASGVLERSYRKVSPKAPVKVKKRRSGLRYAYYEGEFTTLPAFAELKATRSGVATDFDVETLSGQRIDHYAIKYNGYIEVPEDGMYTFYLRSDDGANLYIHDEIVVDNDGSHSSRTRQGYIALEKGKHPIRIEYFEDFLGQTLSLAVSRPGEEGKSDVPFEWLSH